MSIPPVTAPKYLPAPPPTTPPPTTPPPTTTPPAGSTYEGPAGPSPVTINPQDGTSKIASSVASVLQDNMSFLDTAAGGAADGCFSKDDLVAALYNPKSSPQLRAVCQYLLKNPAAFDALDTGRKGKADGLVSQQDLAYANAVQVLDANKGYLDTAAKGGTPDQTISREDLQAAINDPKASPQLKAACKFMLDNGQDFKMLDTAANGGNGDGLISYDDLSHERSALGQALTPTTSLEQPSPLPKTTPLSTTPPSTSTTPSILGNTFDEQAANATRILKDNAKFLDTAAGIGSKDGLIGKEDLEAAVANPLNSPEIKAACKFMLDHPDVMKKLETTRFGDPSDGKIGTADLDYANVVQTINANRDFVDTAAGVGKADGRIGIDDLKAVVNSPYASAELKAACKYLLDHPDALKKLETASLPTNPADGIASFGDLNAELIRARMGSNA